MTVSSTRSASLNGARKSTSLTFSAYAQLFSFETEFAVKRGRERVERPGQVE